MIIAVDFDGTCVTHDFPQIGRDIGAVPVLRALSLNHQLILWTMRSGKYLEDAVEWFEDNGIKLFSVNANPQQFLWTSSPKAFAQLYIDDMSLGCPLRTDRNLSDRPFVDWAEVARYCNAKGILKT